MPPTRRQFALTYVSGAIPCLLLFVWLVTAGHWDLLQFNNDSGFNDAQAHALLEGHLSMPTSVLGIEAFYGRHGHAFMYFGPFPALLRLPVAVFGDGLDGRLTAVSLLLAYALAMAAAGWIVWLVRELVRPDAEFSRGERAAVAGLAVLFGVGSTLFFDGSRSLVYEEASAWGVACSLVAYALMLSFMRAPRVRTVAYACAFSTAAMLSRPAVGLGPVVALMLLAAANAAARIAAARGRSAPVWLVDAGGGAARAWWPMLTAAVALPWALYMAINWVKFGTLVGVPFWHQEIALIDRSTQDVLRHNGGSLAGAKFIPTNLVTYLRPTGLRLDSVFPWVDFPGFAVPNGVRFAVREPTASIVAAMPAWVLLSLGGARQIARPARRGANAGRLRLLLLGAFAGAIPVFGAGVQSQRYTADILPILLLGGATGAYALVRAADANGATSARRVYAIGISAIVGVLAIATCWIMFGLSLLYQRLYTANQRPDAVASLIKWQHDLPTLGGGQHTLVVGDGLPPLGRRGELFVVRDCRAMYMSTGLPVATPELSRTNWVPAERTTAAGDRRFRLHVGRQSPGAILPLVNLGGGQQPAQVLIVYPSGGGVNFVLHGPGVIPAVGPLIHPGREAHTLEVDADQRLGLLTVYLDGRSVTASFWGSGNGVVDPRLDSVAPDPAASGSVVPLPDRGAPVCRSILRHAGTPSAPPQAQAPATDLRALAGRAARRLRDDQSGVGYWLTSYTSSPRYEAPLKEMNTFLTSVLVDLLAPVAPQRGLDDALARARRHLAAQIESDGLVRYHGLPDGPTIGPLGCVITPDADDTALVWRSAGRGAGDPRSQRMLRTLARYRDARGLYRTWLAPQNRYQCVDPGRDPNPADLVVQMHVYLMLRELDRPAARSLCRALQRAVGDTNAWVYYAKAPLDPYLRSAQLRQLGCLIPLPTARLARPVPGQELWSELARRLVGTYASRPDANAQRAIDDLLARLGGDDFARLRRTPPLLFHNDLSATVNRFYWSEDAGYALWLRLYGAASPVAR